MKQTIIEGLGRLPKQATKPRKATKTNTNGLTTAVVDLIIMKGGMAWRSNNGGHWNESRQRFISGNTTAGAPDVNAIINGLYYGIEIKSEKDKLSPAQMIFKDKIEKAGGIYIECRDIQQIIYIFAENRTLIEKSL